MFLYFESMFVVACVLVPFSSVKNSFRKRTGDFVIARIADDVFLGRAVFMTAKWFSILNEFFPSALLLSFDLITRRVIKERSGNENLRSQFRISRHYSHCSRRS